MIPDEVRDRIHELYRELDREIADAGPICQSSGRCCRFKEYGHTLFLSQMEADVLLSAAPPHEGPISSDFCPYQVDNLCTAREPRPLGCRIYFCDPSYQDKCRELSERYVRRMKDLAEEYDIEWRYAPLHVFLNATEPPKRQSLPIVD